MSNKSEHPKTLEELFSELDQVATELEQANVSLEDSFSLYRRGMELLKLCNDKIDAVEKKILVLDDDGAQYEL